MRVGVLKYLIKYNPFVLVYIVLERIFWSGLNGRSIFGLVFNFCINFSPVFIWLLIFKNAGLIPKDIRPPIFVKFAMEADKFVFDIFGSFFSSFLSFLSLCGISALIYFRFYRVSWKKVRRSKDSAPVPGSDQGSSSPIYFEESGNNYELQSFEISGFDISNNCNFSESEEFTEGEVAKVLDIEYCRPLNTWYLAPPVLCAASWFILNIDHAFITKYTTVKDVLSWSLYVLAHFLSPIITAVWLYVFHPPGALKLFSFALGSQNICGVLTHLSFPTAPPWFIEKNGANSTANYDIPGYAAGLTRVDIAFGTHLHSNGFHMSPIVFGAIPSLHSAMAVMAFFFVSYYSRWTIAKLFMFSFVMFQWWATMYLSHHWRIDLIVGMFYSILFFTLIFSWKRGLRKVDEDFVKARMRFDFRNGSTMGMRVFRNTPIQSFFDPLA